MHVDSKYDYCAQLYSLDDAQQGKDIVEVDAAFLVHWERMVSTLNSRLASLF